MDTNPCSLSTEVLKDIHRLDSIINIPRVQTRDRDWMENNYNEPSILDSKNETYRFIISSSGYAKVVRIEKGNNDYLAIVKEFEWGIGDTNSISNVQEFGLSKQKWNSITRKLKELDFWTYPTSIERYGLDGASWSLAAYKPVKDECTLKNFHNISRWSPNDKKFIAMCNLLKKLKKE